MPQPKTTMLVVVGSRAHIVSYPAKPGLEIGQSLVPAIRATYTIVDEWL